MRRPDSGDAVGLGLAMAQRGVVLAAEFTLPVVGGLLLDRRLGTSPALTLLGAVLGFGAGMWHTLRLSRPNPSDRSPRVDPNREP